MRYYFLLSVLLIGSLCLSAQDKKKYPNGVPAPTGFNNDYEKIFTTKQCAVLESTLKKISADKKADVQMCVVTMGPAVAGSRNIDTLLLQIANVWGVGQKNKNNGVMIGISVFHKVLRIYPGTGMSKRLPDTKVREIINKQALPYFKQAKYYEGTLAAVTALGDYLKH